MAPKRKRVLKRKRPELSVDEDADEDAGPVSSERKAAEDILLRAAAARAGAESEDEDDEAVGEGPQNWWDDSELRSFLDKEGAVDTESAADLRAFLAEQDEAAGGSAHKGGDLAACSKPKVGTLKKRKVKRKLQEEPVEEPLRPDAVVAPDAESDDDFFDLAAVGDSGNEGQTAQTEAPAARRRRRKISETDARSPTSKSSSSRPTSSQADECPPRQAKKLRRKAVSATREEAAAEGATS